MMNIRLKQLAAQACLALGLIMSNAQSMDAPEDPRLAQKREAAQFIMNFDGTTTHDSIVQNLAHLFTNGIETFFALIQKIKRMRNDVVNIGMLDQDGNVTRNLEIRGPDNVYELRRWTGSACNPIHLILKDALCVARARGVPDFDCGGADALAACVACDEGKVPTIVARLRLSDPSARLDLIAMKKDGSERWEAVAYRRYGMYMADITYAAFSGIIPEHMGQENIEGHIQQMERDAVARGNVSAETLQGMGSKMRAVAEWAQETAPQNRGVLADAIRYLRLRRIFPREGNDESRQVWTVRTII
jgi:hypothetical protein